MDREFVYTGAIGQTTEILGAQVNAMAGVGKLAEALLGATTGAAAGLHCIPSSPGALTVQLLPGQLYAMETVDSVAFSDAGTNSNPLIKQYLLWTTAVLSCPAPTTAGYSVNYLIQVEPEEVDGNLVTLEYFNPAMLTDPSALPWSGPNNSGGQQPTTRTSTLNVTAKAGTPALAGTQTTPAPDSGYVGLWVVTVTQGQTVITSANISEYSGAVFIPNLLALAPLYSVADTGTANAAAISVSSVLGLAVGQSFIVKKSASANTGAVTLAVNSFTAVSVVWPDGTALAAGDWPASCTAILEYDGTHFNFMTAPGPTVFPRTGRLLRTTIFTNVSGTQYVQVDGGAATTTGAGTFTPLAAANTTEIELSGGGGGSAGAGATTSGQNSAGGGGSSGASAWKRIVGAIGGAQTVTVGAGGSGGVGSATGGNGGATSVGALVAANGGLGGSTAGPTASTSTFYASPGAAPAAGSSGTINQPGRLGNGGLVLASQGVNEGGIAGNVLGGYYGSGGGPVFNPVSAGALTGQAGVSGIVIIREFA